MLMTTACTSNLSWSMYAATGRSIYQTSLFFFHWMQLASYLEMITHEVIVSFQIPGAQLLTHLDDVTFL
jgi:hypothetical protein